MENCANETRKTTRKLFKDYANNDKVRDKDKTRANKQLCNNKNRKIWWKNDLGYIFVIFVLLFLP